MEHRRLGETGLMVSELCLGCMTFGRELDEVGSKELVQRFLEVGGNFIDTADVYADGVSEEFTGRAVNDVREEVVLATALKVISMPNSQMDLPPSGYTPTAPLSVPASPCSPPPSRATAGPLRRLD
jgi:aryl-alcohol dehydrogenase-like predicted oxidoreductase